MPEYSPALRAKYKAHRTRAFGILWFVYGGYYLCRNCYFVAKPAIGGTLSLSNTQLGWIDLAFLSTYAAGQFINGPLGDKVRPKIIIGAGMLTSVLMTVLFGLSNGMAFFLLFWAVNGFAQSTGWTCCVKGMDNWFSCRERGVVMGFWSTCFQVIGFISRLLAAAALGWFGWKYAFFLPAAAMFCIVMVFLFFYIDAPVDAGLPPIEEFHNDSATCDTTATAPISASDAIRNVLRSRVVWTIGLGYLCVTFVRYSLMSWLAKYLFETMNMKASTAGFQSAAPELMGLFGMVFAGYVSDRWMRSRRGPVSAVMLFLLAAACAAQGFFASQGMVWNLFGLGLIYFFMSGPVSIMVGTLAMDCGVGGGVSTAAGVINGMGAIGATLQGPLIGWVSDHYGWGFLFKLFIWMAFASGCLMATLWNHRPATAASA